MMRRALTLAAAAALLITSPASAGFGVSLGPAPGFGTFVPGEATTYQTTLAATVESDEAGAVLTIEDPSTTGVPGHLQHPGGTSLAQPLLASAATAAPGAAGAPPTPVGAAPTVLATYTAPLAFPDPVAITLHQQIGETEPLRTGTYGKTLVLTLTSSTP